MNRIVFSKRSKIQLETLLEYLEFKFSIVIKEKFISNLDKSIKIILKNPDTFQISEINGKYRKCVISKQTTLYYRQNSDEIRILSLFDTRQNPNKISKI
jgi:plasmid stabilization system protein ParE